MTERCPFGDLSNAAGPSTLLSDTPFFRSPVKALNILASPNRQASINACSFDSEQGILTASESDWFSEEGEVDEDDAAMDDSMTTVSPSKRKLNRSIEQQSNSPPPIFFGTPSKTERDCRLKYHTQVRTRRLLRKDSIELTRRKSGGWESHARDERTEVNAYGVETPDQGRYEVAREEDNASVPATDDIPASSSTSSRQPSSDDEADIVNDESETQQQIDTNKDEVAMLADDAVGLHSATQLEEATTILEASVIDPDETEYADWFGQKAAFAATNRSSSPTPSLPSTPTRKDTGRALQLARRSVSLAPSDADSSPGVALALHSFINRPSPLNFGMTSHNASPYVASPTLARSAQMSPEFDQENMVDAWRRAASVHPGEPGGIGESARKRHEKATPVLSPTKVNVRQNLAAWAHARVKTPQSPEKKEWDQLRASMTLSPTMGKESALRESERLLKLATQVKLPASATKTPLSHSAHADPSGRQSPDRRPGSALRQSKLPIPAATSRLPRPFKLSVAKTPARENDDLPRRDVRQATSTANGKVQPVPAKWNTGSAYRKTLMTSHEFAPSQSSSSVSSMHSSSPRHAFARTRPTAFSSPAKSVKPSAPIVRDARLIASRNGLNTSQSQANGPTQSPLPDAETGMAEEGAFEMHGAKSDQLGTEASLPPPASKSGSVGGARRLVIGAGVQDKNEALRVTSAQSRSTFESPAPAAPARRLGVREVRTELLPERSRRGQARPMRRINDLVRKVDHPATVSSASASVEPPRLLSGEARRPLECDGGVTLQRATHSERREPSAAKVPSHIDRVAAATHQDLPGASKAPPVASSRAQAPPATKPKPLPLSSAELSKLTSYHTRCNESSVVQLQFLLVRKQGELRPPSPSSKFRKASSVTAASSSAVLSTKQKAERAAKEAHDRRTRALQRAESGGEATGGVSGGDAPHDTTRHRLGAGDDEVYVSPVRRISLKKVVRWHRALFIGPHEGPASSLRGAATSPCRPTKTCLVGAELTSVLDRFGNVPQAGKPIGSPLARKRKVLVSKIVYDDDDEEEEEEGS